MLFVLIKLVSQDTRRRLKGISYIFEPVEVFVSLAAHVTLERLLFFHACCAWVGSASLWIHNGKGAIAVLV